MASDGAEGDDGEISLDIDDLHMLLQVEHEQIQRRTFTNWINAQLAKRHPPSHVSDLFSDLRDGSLLLDLLEVMSGQSMKRQRGRGVFQQRENLETALNFLKKKSIKLVNINIPDIIDGRPSIILGLVWTIILHCHIEELASSLSFSSRHSSLDSLASLDSRSSSPIPASPVPAGRTSPLHRRFRISAKKALLMWVRDQCQKVRCSVSVKDFKSSWRSGEVFLAILCSLRPELVDLSLVQSRSHQENLEEAFHLAERELHIPRLLDPQDVDVKDPDEKSIMTYVAQFLQYSSDMPAPDDHLQLFPLVHPSVFSPARFTPGVTVSPLHQVSPSERAQEVTCWLQQTHQELLEIWAATERSSYAEKYQVFQSFVGSFDEQKKQVMTVLAATRRCPELNQEQQTLKTAWDHLEDELQRCKADLDLSLPPPLDSVVLWLQRAEAELKEKGGAIKDHSEAAKESRAQQDKLKTLTKEMNHYVMFTDSYRHMDDSGNLTVPHEKLKEIKKRFTDIRVDSKYELIKLEYQETHHTVLDLLRLLSSKVRSWKAPYRTREAVHALLQDWHETVEHQGLLLILMDALQNLKEKMSVYTSKASIGEDSQRVTHQVTEAESEVELIKRDVTATKGTMERVESEWITYNKTLSSLQAWLAQPPPVETLDMSEWTSCHARLNEAGNFLIEMTETSIRVSLAEQLCRVNMQWAECRKKTMFDVPLEPRVAPPSLHMVDSLIHEAGLLMRQPLEVASVPLKVVRQKLQTLRKKLEEVNVSSDFQLTHIEKLQQAVPQLVEAETTCGDLQRAASQLEGRLAELDHWGTDALDAYGQVKEKMHKRHSALESASKGLISRGLQLMHRVVTEWQDLQDFVVGRQKTSPLQHLGTFDMQERISAALTHSQEILGKFSSLGFELQVGAFSKELQSFKAVSQTHKDPETGSYVLTRTKYVNQIINVDLQDPKNQHTNTEDGEDTVVPHVVVQQLSHFQSLAQAAKEAESEAFSKPKAQASPHHPVKPPTAFGSKSPESPVVFKPAAGSVTKLSLSSHHQNIKHKSRAALEPNTPQPPAAPSQPLMIHSEVHSKAQSMARSRLEKTRLRLQGRIQQAIKLFGGKEMTQSQVKKKQKALKILQPVLLEEFLGAVEGFGAFCSEPELQDLMLLSGSVRNQWEDVCREMAAFVLSLKSNIREESFNVLHCGMVTNTLHEATDQTDHDPLQQQIVSQEASCVDGPLRELRETLTPSRSSSHVTDQLAEETQTSETTRCHEGRRRQLEVNTPPAPTDVSAEMQPCNSLALKQSTDITQHHIPPADEAVHVHNKDHIHHDVSTDNQDHLMQSKGSGWEEHQEPSPGAKQQLLKARLLHITESRQQAHTRIQAVVRSNTVESKQEAEWTVIPESSVLPQEECPSAPRGMSSLEKMCEPTESAGDQKIRVTEKLNQITSLSLDISALTVPDSMLFSDLKEIDETLKAEMRKLSEQSTEEDRRGPEATFQPLLCQPLHSSVHHLQQLGQLLDEVQSAVQALDHFLATLRDIKAEIPSLLSNQDPSRQKSETDQEEERRSWQEAMQRLKPAMEQAHVADSRLKAVGVTLNMGGAPVTCQEVVKSVSKLVTTRQKQKEEELVLLERRRMQILMETQKTGNDSAQQRGEHSNLSATEEMSSMEVRRRQQEEVYATNTQREDLCKIQTWRSEGNFLKTRDQIQRRSSQIEKEGSVSLVQKKAALLTTLRDMKGTSEQLRLQEPTLPALQHRTRVLTEMESRLAILVSEVQLIKDASQSGTLDESQTKEMEDLWEETTKTLTEQLEQCYVLTELLKRFQNMRVKLSGTLQRAESTISEQASYVGRDYLQKLHTKVEETKSELVGFGDDVEEIRSVCRQLQSLLRQVPGCTATLFESEADALMDRWLDLSERTEIHLDNLHLCSTLWDGVLQLGAEVENWTNTKLSEFTENPCFQSEDDIKALQNKIMAQEECVQRFHCRAAEIQSLLQSSEIPLELQVVETQMRKKTEQLKELVSETEDVYKQMVATKGQITRRMMECLNSLQEIQDSLHTLSGPDVASVFTKLKDLCWQLQAQDELAQSLLEDVRVLASIAGPVGLQSPSVSGFQLEEKVRDTHQLFSEVEDQTGRNIQELDGLQTETEQLDKWLHAAEEKALKGEELNLLHEESREQRVRSDLITRLVSSLRSSSLRQLDLLERSSKVLKRYHSFNTNIQGSSEEVQPSLNKDVDEFQSLSKSTQSWIGDLKRIVDSPSAEGCGFRTPVEQRLYHAQVVLNATAEGEARLEELKVSGNSLNLGLLHRDDLKHEAQKTTQEAEEQWKNLLQSVQPHYRALQEDSELTSLYLARNQEARLRVEELQLQTKQLPGFFPWPGSAERAHACCLASQLLEESESLQLTLTGLDEKRMELAEKTSNIIWKDSSWVELDTCWSALKEELKGLCSRLEEGLSNEEHFGQLLQDCHHNLTTLQEKMSVCQARKDSSGGPDTDVASLETLLKDLKSIKGDLLQLETLRDSLTTSSTAEARTSIFEKVSDLLNHKRALESSINKQLEVGVLIRNQVIQQVVEETSLLQTELRDLTVSGIHNVSPDIRQLKRWWCTIQDCDNRMTELAVKATGLQRMREKQETPPADVTLNVNVCFKELNSLQSALLQKKQECEETTAEAIRGIINQLQQWRRTETSSQAALDEGLQLQQAVCEVLSEQNLLLNCLGAELTMVLMKSALDVLNESKPALESLSKCLVNHIYSQVEMDLPNRSEGGLRNEDETTPDESKISRFPASSAAADNNRDSDGDHSEKKNHLKEILNPLKEQQPSSVASNEEDVRKQNLPSISTQKEDISQSSMHETLSEHTSDSPPSLHKASPKGTRHPTIPSPPAVSDHITTQSETISILTDDQEQEEHSETTKKVLTFELDVDLQENTGPDVSRCSQELERYDPEKPQRLLTASTSPESDKSDWKSYNTDAQPETFRVCADGEVHGSPDKVFTVTLELQSWNIQPGGDPEAGMSDVSTWSQGADFCDPKSAEDSNTEIPEKNSKLSSALNSPDSNEKELQYLYLSSESNPSLLVEAGMEAVESTNGKEKNVTHEINTESECLLTGVHPAQSSVAELCQSGEQTENSVCSPAKRSEPSGDASTQKDAADSKRLMLDDTKQNTGPAGKEVTGGADCKDCETPAGRQRASLLNEGNDWRLQGALEGTASAPEQIQGSMEPERTAPGFPAGLGSAEVTGGSSESCKHGFTVQEILSDIQSLMERSSIVNRASHTDLNWYLMSSPGEADVRLARTVQRVLACRYQPAQLDVPAMAKQVKEAQEYRCCVQEQVAAMKSNTAMILDLNAVKRHENQWSAALLDASATEQVKTAQLDQVQQYHLQMKSTRTFLEVLAAKKENLSLNSLGSSTLQAEHLHAFLQTMEQKKSMMDDLHHLSSRLSVHLSAAESSGALLAQIGDLQEDWRLLRGSIKRALQHASNSTSQASLLLKEASQLKCQLEAFLELETDKLSSLEVVCLATDLKLYNQLYLDLQSQSEALIYFSLGQKEKDEIEKNLQELGSLLSVSKKKLDSLTQSYGRSSPSKIDKQLQDLTIWAKQAENHISTGPKLALFPEEARIQIDEMRKSQTDFLSRQNKMRLQVEEMKSEVTNVESEDGEVLKTVEDLYETIADSLDHVLNSMKEKLSERQTLLSEFTSLDAWLAETHAKRDPCTHIENVSKADINKLESELKSHRLATVEIENQLKLVDTLAESCTKISTELSPGESRYLVNRLSGLWTDLDGLLAHEKATSWELEELIHERTSSDDELSTIQDSLKDISADLEQQSFPLTQETWSTIVRLKHVLMEHQCQAQELQHCHEDQRNSLLCCIGELLDRCKTLSIKVTEQEKYSHLRRQMEESVDILKNQIMDAKNEAASLDEKFRTYLTLLVELPLVKMQCKEAVDQLESIAHELHPSELNSEREKIQCVVETLDSWERSVTGDVKTLEANLLLGQQLNPELPALTELLRKRKEELEGVKPVSPDEKSIDNALQKYWVICRNIESGMRILECLAQKENVDLRNYKDLYSLGNEAMEECHSWMVSLSQARESLKDYEWAAQRALAFLHNAEATFLSAPGGFLDCTEELKQTRQALKDLEDGFQSHICHLVERVPQQCCLSRSETELLHINLLSQLLVGRAVLEAQAQLRLECLQRCEIRRQSHRKSHEDVRLQVSEFEARLSELASEQMMSYDECIAQQRRAKLVMDDLHHLIGKMEDLRAGCPVQGCGVGKDGELGALWRRWASLRRGVGLLMAHSEQKGEEWRDITTTLECCSHVSSLQTDVLDSSTVEEPLELLAQTEMHQAGLELEQQTLMSLEHQLERVLNVSAPHDPISPGPAGKALVKIQEDVRSFRQSLQKAEDMLLERNILVRKLTSRVKELGSGLERVKSLLEQKSPTLTEAQNVLKCVWDELDAWHCSLMLLESEVQDLTEEQPNEAQLLMDQLTEPLQLYQNAARMAEDRTTFLSKIPACLQEFEDIFHRAFCWLDEAQSWLSSPSSFTTAKSLYNRAKHLQLVLDDSERIRQALQEFRPGLAEISAVCDFSSQEERLDQTDQEVHKMQRCIIKPLNQVLQTVEMVEDAEEDLKKMENNIPRIRTILLLTDLTNLTLMEHLHSRQMMLVNLQSMQSSLKDMERYKKELHLPEGAENLQVFSRAMQLLQLLEELEQVTREQISQLEIKGRDVEETTEDSPEVTTHLEGSAHRRFIQEAFEVSNSEEEEDEEDESRHSSSSDTLTCSIPEDLEETLPDEQNEDVDEKNLKTDVKELETATHQFSLEEETSSATLSIKPEVDSSFGSENIETALIEMDSKADLCKTVSPETMTDDSLNAEAGKVKFQAATSNLRESPKQRTFNIDPQIKSPLLEETRLIPSRPITPFSTKKASDELREEEVPPSDLNAFSRPTDQRESRTCLLEGSQDSEEFPETAVSSAGHEEDDVEHQSWGQLHSQITKKQNTLRTVLKEQQSTISTEDGGNNEKAQEKEPITTGSISKVLQNIHESIAVLRQMVRSGSHPDVKNLYEAVRSILLSLDSTSFLLTHRGEDDPQLKLLQQECVSAQLVTLSDLLGKLDSEVRPILIRERPDATNCLTSLQDCLHTVQLVLKSSHSQLIEQSDLQHQQQELSSNMLFLLDESETGQSDFLLNLKDAPILECALSRHLRRGSGEKLELQNASRSLLRGMARLLELGEECLIERRMGLVPNRSRLQAVLCRHKKLLQVLRSQLAFLQYLFQHEPDALQGQEDEWMQLEVRAKARQQQALEQEVASEKRIQDWICWENLCVRLGRVLDESETFISSGEPGGDGEDDEEESVQRRLDACEQALLRLDDSRVLLGEFLDQRRLLQAEPWFAVSVTQAGGALELRWRCAYRRTEKEIQCLKDIQDSRARFQTDFSLVSERLLGASEHLKTLSGLTDSSDLSHDGVLSSLVKLLDFSMELEATSVLRESVSKDAALLLHLREADCLKLRTGLSQLEVSCNQMTSDLSKIQDHLQQRLMVTQPPLKLLSELEDWLKKMESQLNQENERVPKATNSTEFEEILQKYQVLRTAVTNCQHLLDFMSQPGPQIVAPDVQTQSSERSVFAENLGAVKLQWQLLQRELEMQIRDVEHIHHACAEREGRLQRLHSWIEEQKKQLHQWKQPTSQVLAQKALLEWEAVAGRVKEVSAALKDLKATRVHYEKRGKLSDVAFCDRAVCVSRACGDLSKQMEALRPALQQAVEEWTFFQGALGDVTLFATRVRCALQRQQAPFFSLKQAEGFSDFLQDLQVKVDAEEEQLWAAVDKSYQGLLETLHQETAQALGEKVEEERKRWKETVQQIKDERTKTGEIFSLWKEYSHLSHSCSHYLQHLWREWDESLSSSPEKDSQTNVCCLKNLQHAAEELQRSVGDVLSASKPLIGRLEPLAASLIQSETRLLTRDVLLLNQATLGKMISVEEELEQHDQFQTQLEAAEEQMRNSLHKLQADTPDTYSVKQVILELSDLVPSLVDIQETSGFMTLNNQEKERVDSLNRRWVENVTRASDRNRLFELQPSQNFQEKCERLKLIQEKLERESENRKPLSYWNRLEMLPVHQRLQAEIITGNQLLQDLLCDAVELMENETGEKRSELLVQVACMKRSWIRSVALIGQNWTLMKEQLDQWKTFRHGLRSVRKLLGAVDSLLPPTGPSQYTLHQQQNCTHLYQCAEDSLGLHCPVYTQTVEIGKRLCETMTESDCQSRQQSELLDVMKTWDQTNGQLKTNRDLINTAGQMWSRCQEAMTNILSELDKVRQLLTGRPEDSEEETLIQEVQLPLHRLATGLKELATMKTDLSQYVAASDSALLEQQLEQLHCQWEELCMKVSLRRQEIADRLNAWTIFNDKNKEFCDWLAQMENKVCQSGDLSIEEMVEKLKKDCMEEINLFSENKSHLKQLGEQLLLASDEAKQSQVCGSLQEVNQRWHNLFHHIEARVKKLKETLVTVQQLDKNMSNLRSWLSRIEAELSRPISYTVCHEQEIQRRLAEHQELQRDIEQHTEGVASVLSLCDVLLQNEDAAGGSEAESDSLQETSRSLDQRWRTICAMALDRRLRIEETWTLWCKFLNDYSRFEDWLKMAERTAANPNSADVLFSVAKEELKKFESLQRQVHERLTQLELINNQYRRLARENRTDRARHLKAMVSEGNRRWDTLHRRVTAIQRRLKYFTSQREEFESTRENMVVWLTELDLQLTNVEHFSESDVHQKIQQLNSFQKEITLNTERIDGLIVFGEGLIQRSSPQDAALIEDELEELHSYCQEVFSRLVRFHQRLSQPPMIKEEPELNFSLESSLELIGRPWLGRIQVSLPATPTHQLTSPLERSGRETPVSMDSLPLEWDHTVDVGGSSHEEDEEEEGPYFSALSVSSRSLSLHECPRWRSSEDTEDQVGRAETTPTLTSTPVKQGYLHLMSQCSGSIENIKRVSLILDDEEQEEELGLIGLNASDKQSGVIERWELCRAQSRCSQQEGPQDPQQLLSDLDDITSWLENVIPELDRLLHSHPAAGIEDMEARAKDLKEMEKMFSHYKSIMLTANLQTKDSPDLQEKVARVNRDWSRACTGLQQWDSSLRRKLIRCQEFHESLHSLLLWLAHAESRCSSVDVNLTETSVAALQQHKTLTELQEELRCRQTQQASLQGLWSQLQPEEAAEDADEAQEKLHVTGNKLMQLVKQVDQNLHTLQQHLDCESALAIKTQSASADTSQEAAHSKKGFSTQRETRESSPPRSFFYRLLRAAFPLQLLLLLLLLLPCLIPLSESDHGCTVTNNFARSFHPMLHYTNGPPPT